MLTFDVITLFPDLFTNHLNNLPFKRAIENSSIECRLTNLRDFSVNEYGSVDAKPYGGGVGMILMIEPLYEALHHVYKNYYKENSTKYITKHNQLKKITPKKKDKIIVLSPKGEKFTQEKAKEYSKLEHITFVCGRYEGIDNRISDIADVQFVSIGDFVLSGGELPTLVIMESITRILPGVLVNPEALETESHNNNSLEHPQYTRPEDFLGLKVPEILLSGHHKKIEKWKKENSIQTKG